MLVVGVIVGGDVAVEVQVAEVLVGNIYQVPKVKNYIRNNRKTSYFACTPLKIYHKFYLFHKDKHTVCYTTFHTMYHWALIVHIIPKHNWAHHDTIDASLDIDTVFHQPMSTFYDGSPNHLQSLHFHSHAVFW